MTAKPSDLRARPSRRAVLQAAASAAAVLGMPAAPATAQLKVSQQSVAYQDQPDGAKRCGLCAQFMPPGACRFVQGHISPQGYCRLFVPASQQG